MIESALFTASFTKIKQYADRHNLLISVDDIEASDEIKKEYIQKRVSYLLSHSGLQKLIDGMQIPVELSDLEQTLSALNERRKIERKKSLQRSEKKRRQS